MSPAPRARLAGVVVVAFAIALAAVTIRDGVGPHDEGLMLVAAGRIASGQLPYRDFWWNYGPGEPLLLAGLVKAFGPSLLAWRIVRVLAGAAVAWLCLRLARALGAGEGWAAGAGLAAGSAVAWPLTSAPTVFGLVPALGALVLLARAPRAERDVADAARGRPERDALAAGLLAGVAAWLRPELGATAAIGGLVLLGRDPGGWARLVGTTVGATLLLYLPFVLAAPGAFADDVLGFTRIQGLQRLPFPLDPPADPNKAFETLFPAILVGAAALWALVGRARPLALLPLVLSGIAYLLARTDEFHLVPLAVVLAPALAVAAGRGRGPRPLLIGAALVLVGLGGVGRQTGRLLHPAALAAVPGGVGDGVRTETTDAAALRVLVPRLRALGRPLFVAPPRLDRVRFGDPLLNVIAELPNPTRYDVMQPGVVTRDDVQREIVADLVRTRATVVRWRAPAAAVAEDNGAGREQGSTRFDRFLTLRYRPVFTVGDYVVLVPR